MAEGDISNANAMLENVATIVHPVVRQSISYHIREGSPSFCYSKVCNRSTEEIEILINQPRTLAIW